jgi:hypothetical protein
MMFSRVRINSKIKAFGCEFTCIAIANDIYTLSGEGEILMKVTSGMLRDMGASLVFPNDLPVFHPEEGKGWNSYIRIDFRIPRCESVYFWSDEGYLIRCSSDNETRTIVVSDSNILSAMGTIVDPFEE